MDKQFMAFANQVSRTLIAAGLRKKGGDEYEKMKNERYQRTFTDEYLFGRKSHGREPVSEEVRKGWEKLR